MPSYELLYFPARGRAEQIRVLFALHGVAFTDTPVTNWAELKPDLQFGRLPVLIERDDDGGEFVLPESGAIMRHLARAFGAYGEDARSWARADALADFVTDERNKLVKVIYAAMVGTTEDEIAKFWQQLPAALGCLERSVSKSSDSAAGWFIGARPTFADVVAFDFLDALEVLDAKALADYPGLKGFVARVRALPALGKFLAERDRH